MRIKVDPQAGKLTLSESAELLGGLTHTRAFRALGNVPAGGYKSQLTREEGALMLKAMRDSISRSELITVALGLTVALTAWTLISAVVTYLILPLITVFIGEAPFAINSFTIDTSEFRYGQVIEAAIIFLLAAALAVIAYRRSRIAAGKTRACPECTSAIPVAAKRCPFCTAVVQPGAA